MGLGNDGYETDALFSHRRFVGGVGGGDGGDELRDRVVRECFGDGFQFGGSSGVGIAVGEFVEASEDSVLEFSS